MKRLLVFAASILFACSGQAASSAGAGGKGGGKLGFSSDSGHGSTGGGGGGGAFSTTGRTMYRDPRSAPPLDERRKVSEQDCSKPVDLTSGNLRCR